MATRLTMLRGNDSALEVVLYPADLLVRGEPLTTACTRAAIVKQATFSDAYLTWTKEGNDLEDKLRAIWNGLKDRRTEELDARAVEVLHHFDRELTRAQLTYDEWLVLYRERLQAEESVLEALAGMAERPVLSQVKSQDETAA